jgi:hypothetical protein
MFTPKRFALTSSLWIGVIVIVLVLVLVLVLEGCRYLFD